MEKNKKVENIIEELKKCYPEALCALEHGENPLRLLIMARLSAQCTDERVNKVSEIFFKKFKDLDDIINADLEDIENIVRPCGLYRTKAKNIKDMCIMIKNDFNGEIPDNMEDLVKLPGVGRKIANLIVGDVFGKPSIVTDTHCIRIANRLGLANSDKPYEVEKALWKIIPPEESSDFCHRIVLFGREYCKARNPQCAECPIIELCKYNYDKENVKHGKQ